MAIEKFAPNKFATLRNLKQIIAPIHCDETASLSVQCLAINNN